MNSPKSPAGSQRPLALLVPVGNEGSKAPQPVVQPIMVLRSQGLPFAVLLVSPGHAYIRAIAASDLRINDLACPEHELVTGDRIGLGPVVYEFQSELPCAANGRPRAEAFLASDDGSHIYPIRRPIVMIGGGERADVRLGAVAGGSDIAVVLEVQDGHALVSLDSPPGFSVNGESRTRHRLAEGDVIEVGGESLRYSAKKPIASAIRAPQSAPVKAMSPQLQAVSEPEPQVREEPAVQAVVTETPIAEVPPKKNIAKPLPSRNQSNKLAAWGPLAQAVISAQSLPTMDAPGDALEAPVGRSKWWVVVLVVILIAGGGAAAWWKWGRG